jgi:hypothetical protein
VLIRHDDPDFEFVAEWNMAKAKAANLTGKGVWKSYPGAMLRSRAITEVARMGAPDALYGVIYTAEELGAEVNAEGDPVILDEAPAEQAPAAAEQLNRYREHQPEPAPEQPEAPVDWSALFTGAVGDRDKLTALRHMGRKAGLPNTYGMFSAIDAELAKLDQETPVEGTVI